MKKHPSAPPFDLPELFRYHPPSEGQREKYAELRSCALSFAEAIEHLCPPCPDTTAAIRKVREALMTANAAIALEPPG